MEQVNPTPNEMQWQYVQRDNVTTPETLNAFVENNISVEEVCI